MQKYFLALLILVFTFIESVSSQTTPVRPTTSQATKRSLKLVRSFEAQSKITAIDMSRDGRTLVTANNGDIQVWNLDIGNVKTHSLLDSQYATIKAIAISPDQRSVVTGSSGLDITTRSNSSGCTSSSGNGGFNWSCDLGSSSTQTIKSTGGSAIQIWEISTGKNIGTLESTNSSGFEFGGFGSVFDFFSFSADGNLLITSQLVDITRQCQIKFRDLKTGKVISQRNSKPKFSLKTGQSCKQILAINPRASRQVTYGASLSIHNIGSDDKPNRLSLRLEGKELEIDEFFSNSLNIFGGSIVVSPDGRNIAVSDGNSIFIWQPEVNKFPQYRFVGKRSRDSDININTLSFSPDNQYLAFGDEDGTIRLWDFKNNNQPSQTIAHVRQPLQFIGFNEQALVTVGSDRTIKIWEVN